MEESAGEEIFLDESVGRQVVSDLGLPWSEAASVWRWLASPPRITVARQAADQTPPFLPVFPVMWTRIRNYSIAGSGAEWTDYKFDVVKLEFSCKKNKFMCKHLHKYQLQN